LVNAMLFSCNDRPAAMHVDKIYFGDFVKDQIPKFLQNKLCKSGLAANMQKLVLILPTLPAALVNLGITQFLPNHNKTTT